MQPPVNAIAAMAEAERTRDKIRIIFGEDLSPNEIGELKRFKTLTKDTILELIKKNYIDPEKSLYDIPSVDDYLKFIDWAEKNVPEDVPMKICFHGFFNGYIGIEGILIEGKNLLSFEPLVVEFAALYRSANGFVITNNQFSCWFDLFD